MTSEKKTSKTTLNKSTIRELTADHLNSVAGGRYGYYYQPPVELNPQPLPP